MCRYNERLKTKTEGSKRLVKVVIFLKCVFIFSGIRKGEGQGKESVTLKL